MGKFADRHLVLNLSTDSVDAWTGTVNTACVNMKGWDECTFTLAKTTGPTGTLEARIHSSTDTTPTSTHGVSRQFYRSCKASDSNSEMTAWVECTSSGFMITAGAHEIWQVYTKAEYMYDGDNYVWLNTTEVVDHPLGGATICTLTGPSYGRKISDDVLA